MRYYCNVCKKDITKAELLYSIDKFDRPLCREHQKTEIEIRKPPSKQSIETKADPPQEQIEEFQEEESRPRWKATLKKVVVATGKGIVKGTKKLIDASKKTIQIRRWKDQILRRMNKGQLRKLCREKNIATKTTRSDMKENKKTGEFYWKDYTHVYTFDELVGRIKNRISVEDIISYAKRNHINIRDILQDIERKKQEWRIKQIDETMKETGIDLYLDLEKTIREFKPLRRYYQEILYQDSLASWLRSKFPDTDVEIQRGSSRPDIVVNDVAIEIKGPTSQRDLDSVPSKCMRYSQNFNNRVIVVLFDVQTSQRYYEEWERGLKKTHPDVIIIRK